MSIPYQSAASIKRQLFYIPNSTLQHICKRKVFQFNIYLIDNMVTFDFDYLRSQFTNVHFMLVSNFMHIGWDSREIAFVDCAIWVDAKETSLASLVAVR